MISCSIYSVHLVGFSFHRCLQPPSVDYCINQLKDKNTRYSLGCKLKVNFSEAAARILHVLLHLSLLLLRISFPSPILCYTSDVRACSKWVW